MYHAERRAKSWISMSWKIPPLVLSSWEIPIIMMMIIN